MMNAISFMSANFVARQAGYQMPSGWGQGERAASGWFGPLNTFEERFGEMLGEVAELGFAAIDLWTGHLDWRWATPAHLEIARRTLAQHKLRPVSYAGTFGATPAELEAACLVCAHLGIPVLGGGLPLLATDRAAAVAILRRHGLVFGLENHPEKSVAELLGKLGEGDADVIGVTADTGWFATQGCDAPAALRALAGRVKHVHVKDVLARRGAATGYVLKDMGHETCELGQGIARIRDCLHELRAAGYRGPLSIEHEPEDFDPREDVRRSRATLAAWLKEEAARAAPADPVGVAIVGCGNIAAAYAAQINSYPHVRLVGSQDLDQARAEALAERFGGKVYATLGEVLADPQVEVVVNLTIHHAHPEVIRRCLEAGRHVHTEKPLALGGAEAHALVDLAEASGLRLSSAPTTWLGEAQQAAWKLVRDGAIGQPRVAMAEVNWGRIESWHPNPAPFYDVGVVYDVAVYPLTLLTAWFGPARRVIAGGGIVFPDRSTTDGTPFTVTSPDWTVAVVEFAGGMRARITSSFYVGNGSRQTGLEVHGDAGSIVLERWDIFDSPLWLANAGTGQTRQRVVLPEYAAPGIEFARGLSDLAHALRENRPHKTQGAHAAHVVDIVEAILTSIGSGEAVTVTSSFPAP